MLDLIKKIREKTGAGMVNIKKALEEASGDEEKALDILKKQGQAKAIKKSEREAKEGMVVSYVHSNSRVGSMVKIFCETDFVARNDEFQQLGKDIAMHVTAMSPKVIRPEDISEDFVSKEKEIWIAVLTKEGKTKEMIEKIIPGKEKKFREESSLLTQSFVKDPSKTVGELVTEKIGKIGENIQIGEFIRFEL